MTANTTTTAPVAADVAAKLSKELNATIKKARQDYSTAVAAARVERDKVIAQAYHTFSEATGTTA